MAINEVRSYTEYKVETPTTDFNIGFQYYEGEDAINILIDDVDIKDTEYEAVQVNDTVIRITPPISNVTLRLERETDIDVNKHNYSAGAIFTATQMDENFEQIRKAQQEVRDGVEHFYDRVDGQIGEFTDLVSEVQSEFTDVKDLVNVAVATATDASIVANTALVTANSIDDKATEALDTAERAFDTAYEVNSLAANAQASATSAVNIATNASNTANNALSTAQGIAGTANSALDVATAAEQTADDALSVANDALNQTTLQPATASVLGGIKVGTEFTTNSTGVLSLSGNITRNLSVTGTITATGNITAFSDRRLKYDIEYITDALDRVTQLNGVTYYRLSDDTRNVGLIAQDVQRVLPEAVKPQNGYLTVDYLGIIGLLVEAIKDLDAKVKSLGG